jgi:hypothetical protein
MTDSNYWDRKHIHYCVESYQSCSDITTACNIQLSTWAGPNLPWKQSGNQYGTVPDMEKDLGYSFNPPQVSCPECIAWMKEKLGKCNDCGIVAVYSYCRDCSTKRLIEEGLLKDGKYVRPK